MWKWVKFSFRVWAAYLTAQIIIAASATVIIFVLFTIADLVELLPR